MSFIAEDIPWYQVTGKPLRAMTDEDYAMSAPRRLGKFGTVKEAREALAMDLLESSTYSFVVRGGEQEKYVMAAQAVRAGVDGVQIHGRYYRVREA